MLVNVSRLQTKMDAEGLDGLVATTIENVYYLTGIQSVALRMFPHDGQCYAVITRDLPTEPYFISSRGEIDQVLDGFPGIHGTITFGSFFRELPEAVQLTEDEQRLKAISVDNSTTPGPLEALVTVLELMGLADKKIGIDELGLRIGFFELLGARLPNASCVRAAELLRWVRKVKTPEEIRRLRASAQVTEHAILAAAAIAAEGITEQEMVREFERSVVSQGGVPKFTFIRFGRNGVGGQVLPGRTPLRRGDTIWFDVDCLYQGYWSDLARNFSLGEPSQRARKIYQAMLEGEQRAIEETRPGMTGNELYELTVDVTRQAGVPHYRRHHVGHAIGLEAYEQPLLAPNVQDVIEEGSVINIETPYYEFGLGALHVEDPFVVGSGSNKLLTTLSRDLHIID